MSSQILMISSIRPTVKIGLLASFEGVHRRNGYAALAAMRQALDTHQGGEIAVIPLALHIDLPSVDLSVADLPSKNPLDKPDVQRDATIKRTVQKLLADPAVKAVVGPYDPWLIEQIKPLMVAAEIPWFLPLALDPTQIEVMAAFAHHEHTQPWTVSLVPAVAKAAAEQDQTRLILAGGQLEQPDLPLVHETPLAVPVVRLSDPLLEITKIKQSDALLWLGTPAAGVTYLADLAQHQLDIPIWFGPTGDDPILRELLADKRLFDSNKLYWVTWLDDQYLVGSNPTEMAISTSSSPLTPTAYLTYRATQAAIATLDHTYVPPTSHWRASHFILQADGTSKPFK